MELCSDSHDEVCYESRNCPACIAMEETAEVRKELDAALEEVEELKAQVEEGG